MRPSHLTSVCFTLIAITLSISAAGQSCPQSGSWSTIENPNGQPVGNALLLTDGIVMLQSNNTSNNDFHTWYQLKPDSVGSYVNGSLSYLTSIPQTPTYNPLDYASAVLADGRVVIQGGEYNYGNQTDHQLGYIYQPTDGSWTPLSPPNGWSEMWDDPSVMLSDGRFMEGQVDCPGCGSMLAAIYDPSGGTWTATGTGKWDKNNEEGWTLLPDRTVFTVDTKPQDYNYYQIYDPGTGAWTHPGTTPLGCITLIAGR